MTLLSLFFAAVCIAINMGGRCSPVLCARCQPVRVRRRGRLHVAVTI